MKKKKEKPVIVKCLECTDFLKSILVILDAPAELNDYLIIVENFFENKIEEVK